MTVFEQIPFLKILMTVYMMKCLPDTRVSFLANAKNFLFQLVFYQIIKIIRQTKVGNEKIVDFVDNCWNTYLDEFFSGYR